MYAHRIEFTSDERDRSEQFSELTNSYLGTLRMNGQICGSEWPLIRGKRGCSAIVLTPEAFSLDERFDGKYTREAKTKLSQAGIAVGSSLMGQDYDGLAVCDCEPVNGYILFTTYLSLESPARCMECFKPRPLYRFPSMPSGEFYEVITWQSNYQACDRLQMNCMVLEAEATGELSGISSELTIQGRKTCDQLSTITGQPFYYYLYRADGENASAEESTLCPACGGTWLLAKPLHSLFHFKCDNCRIVSNYSWNLTWDGDLKCC